MCVACQREISRVPLVHREAVDPDVRQDVRIGQAEPIAELDSQAPEHVRRDVGGVGDDQDEVALVRGRPLDDRARRVVGQELRDRALDLAPRPERQVGQALGPEPARSVGQLVDLATCHAGHPGRHDRLHPTARRECRIEDTETRRRRPVRGDEDRPEVDQLHPEPDIGLVRPVPLERVLIGQHRERDLKERALRDGDARDLDRHRFDEGHDGRLVDEAHLEVELGEFELAVAAQVLVSIAAGDLHVAVDAGDHQQLLELLRALRQRVDHARLEATRYDEVARALWGALDERRRLDLDEAVGVMDIADGLDHPAAEHQPALHRLAPDVEVAVLEPQALVDRSVGFVDVERRRLRLGQDRHGRGPKLDRACRQLRVFRARQIGARPYPRP